MQRFPSYAMPEEKSRKYAAAAVRSSLRESVFRQLCLRPARGGGGALFMASLVAGTTLQVDVLQVQGGTLLAAGRGLGAGRTERFENGIEEMELYMRRERNVYFGAIEVMNGMWYLRLESRV